METGDFFSAAREGDLSLVRFLLENGANLRNDNDDALRHMVQNRHIDVDRQQEVFPDDEQFVYLNDRIEDAYYFLSYNRLDDMDIPQSTLNILLKNEMNGRWNLEMIDYLYNRGADAKITPNYIKSAGRYFTMDERMWRIVMFFVAKGFLPATTDLLAAASNGDADKVAEIIATREFIPPEIIDAYVSVRDSKANLLRLVPFDHALDKKGEQYGDLIKPSTIMAYALAYAHGHEQVIRALEPYLEKKYKQKTLPLMTFYLNSIPKLPDIPALERIVQLNPTIVDTVITRAIQTDNLDAVKQFGEDFTTIAVDAIVAKKLNILKYAVRMISEKQLNSEILMETVIEKRDVDAFNVVYSFSSIRINPKQFTEIAGEGLYDFIHYLVENGLVQKYKDEALILASQKGNYKLVDYLVKRGADKAVKKRHAFRVAANEDISNLLGQKSSFSLVHRPTDDLDSVFMTPFDPSIGYRMCVNGHPWLYDPVNEVGVCPLCRAGARSELFINAEYGPPVIYAPEPNPGLIKEQKIH